MTTVRYKNAKEKEEWLEYVAYLIFNEWVKGDNSLFINKKERLSKDDKTKPFIILDEDIPVGCFLITYNDIKGYDYNPNLACVCVEKKYRGKGYSNYILKYSLEEFKKMGIREAYLKTALDDFYEKVGWTALNESCEGEKIYKIKLK